MLGARPFLRLAPVLALLATTLACGAGNKTTPAGGGLMDQTFAGQNACNPKNHDRPFIINWDATDQGGSNDPALTKTRAQCQAALDTYLKLYKKVKPYGDADPVFTMALMDVGASAPQCFAKSGDCAGAFKAFTAVNDARDAKDKTKAPGSVLRAQFDATVPACKGK